MTGWKNSTQLAQKLSDEQLRQLALVMSHTTQALPLLLTEGVDDEALQALQTLEELHSIQLVMLQRVQVKSVEL